MGKVLVVKAHPSSHGFTHRICSRIVDRVSTRGNEVFVLDLYSKEFELDFLKFEDKKNMPIDDVVLKIQGLISESEELVFVCPVWWYCFPAVVKNFFDRVLTSGFAYNYDGGIPKGLLSGKRAKIFMTCDGPWFYYFFLGLPGRAIFRKTLWFCGIKLDKFVLFSSMFKKSELDLENCLLKVEKFF